MTSWILRYTALVLLLSACGGGNNAASESSASPSIAPSAVPSAAGSALASATPAGVATTNVAYTDLSGVFGAQQIVQLASLGVLGVPATGAFLPSKPVLRREFVRWLLNTNNVLWASDPSLQIHPATPGESPYFSDVPADDADFATIQGMQDAGISVGFPDKSFKPDIPITREQALAIKSLVDCGGVDPNLAKDTGQAYFELPDWKDKKMISKEYVAAIETCLFADSATNPPGRRFDNVGRAFGAITQFNPKLPLTRAQAALMLWRVGAHKPDTQNYPPRSAPDALAFPSSSATP